MNLIAGACFLLSEGALLYWLLCKNDSFLHSVVFREGLQTEGEPNPSQEERFTASMKFRIGLILVCTLLAGASGYLAANVAGITPYDLAKLWAALLGISAAMLVDFYIYLIPNRFLLYMCAFRLLLFGVEVLSGRPDWKESGLNSLIGLGLTFVVMLLLSLITRQGIGMGDVKLLSTMGFLCGIYTVMNLLVYGLILCALCSAALLLTKKKGVRDKVPFGPFLYGGYVICLLLGAV